MWGRIFDPAAERKLGEGTVHVGTAVFGCPPSEADEGLCGAGAPARVPKL